MDLLRARDAEIPLKTACEVLGRPRATAHRHLGPRRLGSLRPLIVERR